MFVARREILGQIVFAGSIEVLANEVTVPGIKPDCDEWEIDDRWKMTYLRLIALSGDHNPVTCDGGVRHTGEVAKFPLLMQRLSEDEVRDAILLASLKM